MVVCAASLSDIVTVAQTKSKAATKRFSAAELITMFRLTIKQCDSLIAAKGVWYEQVEYKPDEGWHENGELYQFDADSAGKQKIKIFASCAVIKGFFEEDKRMLTFKTLSKQYYQLLQMT